MLMRIIGYVSLTIILANMLLFSFRVYSGLIFWGIIIIIALIAFPGMKWMQKKAISQKNIAKRKK